MLSGSLRRRGNRHGAFEPVSKRTGKALLVGGQERISHGKILSKKT